MRMGLGLSLGRRVSGPSYGPELITNGNGASIVGWTSAVPGDLTSTGGRLRVTNVAGGGGHFGHQSFATDIGSQYRAVFSAFDGTGPALAAFGIASGDGGLGTNAAGVGTVRTFTATATTTFLSLYLNDTVAGQYAEFDDISIKKVL